MLKMRNRWTLVVICGCLSIGLGVVTGFKYMFCAKHTAVVIAEYWDAERGEKCSLVCIIDSSDYQLSGLTEKEVKDVVMWEQKKVYQAFAKGVADLFGMPKEDWKEPPEVLAVLENTKKRAVFTKGVALEIRGRAGGQEHIIKRRNFKIDDDCHGPSRPDSFPGQGRSDNQREEARSPEGGQEGRKSREIWGQSAFSQ
jgi:hypothetical protein